MEEEKRPFTFTGLTAPFIAILRALHTTNELAENTLFFANKTAEDIITNRNFQ